MVATAVRRAQGFDSILRGGGDPGGPGAAPDGRGRRLPRGWISPRSRGRLPARCAGRGRERARQSTRRSFGASGDEGRKSEPRRAGSAVRPRGRRGLPVSGWGRFERASSLSPSFSRLYLAHAHTLNASHQIKPPYAAGAVTPRPWPVLFFAVLLPRCYRTTADESRTTWLLQHSCSVS